MAVIVAVAWADASSKGQPPTTTSQSHHMDGRFL
jgi:hypothetical protein